MQKRKWTQQEEEILIRLYEDPKVFPKDIAELLGHASLDTTRLYLQKSKDEQRRDFNKSVTW